MSAISGIEWTDATWNPVTGCTKVSAGCDHCYAETLTERFHGTGAFAHVTLHDDRLATPLRWRAPRRVFVNSMADDTTLGRAGHPPALLIDHDGTVHCTRDAAGSTAVPLIRVGKEAAGRQLDGRIWEQYPQAVTA